MNQQTLKQKQPRTANVVPVKPAIDRQERRNEILESIAVDCLVESKEFVKQSKAFEGE